MVRPVKIRCIRCEPRTVYFKPRGIPLVNLEEVILKMEEFEALRLADWENLEQEEAARKMKISRPTFTRVLDSARKKIADALINAKALKIEGGDYIMLKRKFSCSDCKHTWEVSYGTGRPSECPECRSANIHRAEEDRGMHRSGAYRGYARRGGRGPYCRRGLIASP